MFVRCLIYGCAPLKTSRPIGAPSSSETDTPASQSSASSPSSASGSIKNENQTYTVYSGSWRASDNIGDESKNGGTLLDIQIDAQGNLTGNIATVADNAGHIAEADFTGSITDGVGKATFDEDGWGHAGTITFSFKNAEIDAAVAFIPSLGGTSGYALRTGTIQFIRK